jgi:hypothetical protein
LVLQLRWESLTTEIYKTIILPFVLYGCETWPLTMREECKVWLFENRILRRIFRPKRDDNQELEGSQRGTS